MRDALHLAVAPAVFLLHFGSVYGFSGLGCAFGWEGAWLPALGAVPLGVLALTALALIALFALRPKHRPPPEAADDVAAPYDPRERSHFMAMAARMTTWLAAAGVVAVALTSVLAQPCT